MTFHSKTALLITLLFFGFSLRSQSVLDQKIDVSFQQQPLAGALLKICEQANVDLNSSVAIPEDITVDLNAVDQPVGKVLTMCLRGTRIGFQEQDGVIRIFSIGPVEYTLSGYIRDQESGERLIGANVVLEDLNRGVSTNRYGYFALSIPEGEHRLRLSYLGYQTQYQNINLQHDRALEFDLESSGLLEVVLVNTRSDSSLTIRQDLATLNNLQLSTFYSAMGEPDLLQGIQKLPGVSSGADGIGGLHVRGGNTDQNLILLDDTPVYNPSHSIGLFSIFNPDVIKSVTFYRSGIPAAYGGRLSSVLDVRGKDGATEKVQGKLGVGVMASNVLLEVPIAKGKGGFLVAARRTHFDPWFESWSTRRKDAVGETGSTSYFFYDFQSKFHYNLGDRDRVFLSLYGGGDRYNDENEGGYYQDQGPIPDGEDDILFFNYGFEQYYQYKWGNQIGSLRWNHLYNDRLFSNLTLIYSHYQFESEAENIEQLTFQGFPVYAGQYFSRFSSEITDYSLRLDFDYFADQHQLQFGGHYTRHLLTPGAYLLQEETSNFDSLSLFPGLLLDQSEDSNGSIAHEFSTYIEDSWKYKKWEVAAGLRLDALYNDDQLFYLVQPRFNLAYRFNNRLSFFASADSNGQLLHLLSLLDAGLPNDIWVAATSEVPPQRAWQVSTGLKAQPFPFWNFTVEGYAKWMNGVIVFQNEQGGESGIVSLNALNWEEFVRIGSGKSFGLETFHQLQFEQTQFTVSYTLSKSDRTFQGLGTIPFQYDHRHQLNLSWEQQLYENLQFQAQWTFQSGMPARLYLEGVDPGLPILDILGTDGGEDIGDRLPSYHRLDISLRYQFGHRLKQSLSLGIYNVYNRQNIFAVLPSFDLTGTPESRQINGLPLLPIFRYEISL